MHFRNKHRVYSSFRRHSLVFLHLPSVKRNVEVILSYEYITLKFALTIFFPPRNYHRLGNIKLCIIALLDVAFHVFPYLLLQLTFLQFHK